MSQDLELAPIIVNIVSTEKAYRLAEKHNYLVFKVRREATKTQIKEAIEKLYNIKVLKINTVICRDGYKKVYARLSPEYNALDILERLTR